ncbi:hypothetical protein WJX74_002717 [Apatococcus lobatus]|uniref:Transcription factor TFIIIC triple barrel domain-containing protein n=1 Tax=Apatococcus lobatus TaxID=904363 RepID=A0AAW1RHW6_9CHLO
MRESLACLILKASATASQEIFVECLQSYSQAVCRLAACFKAGSDHTQTAESKQWSRDRFGDLAISKALYRYTEYQPSTSVKCLVHTALSNLTSPLGCQPVICNLESSPQLASRPDAGEVVFREGEEEATYVVVDFQDLDKADQPKAGEPIKLEGLDSNQPKLTLVNGVAFTGSYEQTIGTDLLLSIHQQPNAPKSLSYLCHTENRLKFLSTRRELFLASPRCPVTRHNGEKEDHRAWLTAFGSSHRIVLRPLYCWPSDMTTSRQGAPSMTIVEAMMTVTDR